MPYGKLPLNVIRNYNLRIVDTGRYRMLKEICKSKSEVAACNDFASWLIKLQKDNFTDKKIVLVFFEPRHSKILQLFQVYRHFVSIIRLVSNFQFVLGFGTLPSS
jgi:maternal-effect protein exuperantia